MNAGEKGRRFSLLFSINLEHLLSPYYVWGTVQYTIKCNKYVK